MAYSLRELKRDLTKRNTPVQRWVAGRIWQMRNARAIAASSPDPAHLEVVFAIPLISRAMAENWIGVQKMLANTLACLRRQSDPRWRAIVCCQDRPEAVAFDAQVRYLPFDEEVAGYDKFAKTARIRQWLAEGNAGAGYYYPLDADDLIHPELAGYILSDDNRSGYQVDKGYILDHATLNLAVLQPPDAAYPHATHFYRSCGSSSALWFDFTGEADFATVLSARGNHRKVVRNMGYLGFDIAPVPYHAAIYVMNHGDNLRQKRGRMSGKMKHFDLNPMRDADAVAQVGETFRFGELFPERWPAPPVDQELG